MRMQEQKQEHEDHGRHAATIREEEGIHDRHVEATTAPDEGLEHHGGHDKHAGHSVGMFRDKTLVSVLLTIPVLLWSEMIQEWFGYTAPGVPGADMIPAAFGTALFVYGGSPFLRGGWRELRIRQPGMMLLIAMAISVAFGASLATTAGVFELDFWWELALLIDVMLLGHWQEMKAIGQASSALDALAALLPDEAEVVRDGDVVTVAASQLALGDLVVVRPGGRVPADGVVTQGDAAFDESMITGESRAVRRSPGDRVVAGTVATDSSVRIRVDAVGEDTALAGIRRLVADAQASRSRAQTLADRAAALLFYVALATAIVTFAIWSALGEPDRAVERAITVLVIACPHALGLAIPLVIAISTSMSARAGILVKDRLALERMRQVDTVLFDKTGTLTMGAPQVIDAVAVDGDREGLLRLAAAAESDSEHPIARAIVAAAGDGARPPATEFRAITGRGIEAQVEGREVAIGGPALLRERAAEVPAELSESAERWGARGASVVTVLYDGAVIGAIAVADTVRPSSAQAVQALADEGIRVALVTGDSHQVARAIAADLGIEEVHAEVLPEHKASVVEELERSGRRVAMVGDGVNDAPALAGADVGIAIGAGTDVAIESAGVVLASDDPRGVLGVVQLSRASYRKMVQNLIWATGYNVIAIPLAAGAFAWAGLLPSPALGAVLMSVSTIVVALNAQLLRSLDLRPA